MDFGAEHSAKKGAQKHEYIISSALLTRGILKRKYLLQNKNSSLSQRKHKISISILLLHNVPHMKIIPYII